MTGVGDDDDLGPVTDRIGRVHGRTVTASSRGTRGQHSTYDLSATLTLLAPSFLHGTSAPGSSTQPPTVPFRFRPPLQPYVSHNPVPYEAYGSPHLPSHPQTQYMIPTYMLPLYDLAYHIDLQPRSLNWSLVVT
ncbi:hypothetical protein M9H77_28443 [Catharanthus roseus]|uniref:Uncharacterized protein n=1 Tax=Catharanthus roseus TaxID=4058 RepID=A0ACC0AFK1_CATRO|nr:hypothetical protein M9H77_28443 [Catharanthus roseus]